MTLLLLLLVTLSATALGQIDKCIRFFESKPDISAQGLPYAEPKKALIVERLSGTQSMLGVPRSDSWKVEWASETHASIRFSQSFQILDTTIRDSPKVITLYTDMPSELFKVRRLKISELDVAKQNVAPWEPGKTYALLINSYDAKKAQAQMVCERAVKATHLEGKDAQTAFFMTIVNQLAKLESPEVDPLLYYFGKVSMLIRGEISVSYGGSGEFGQAVGNYALQLASKASGKKRVWLSFVGGIWGNTRGYEPFFAELRPAINANKSTVDTNELRILAGCIPAREHFYLDYVLTGVPPTRNSKSMLEFALGFTDRPDVMAFLMEFMIADSRIKPKESMPSKEDWIKAYLATDEGMSYQDRYTVYQGISGYFLYLSGIQDLVSDAIQNRMNFPDGLRYPGDDNHEIEWKQAIDKYWDVKRKIKPL